jgi:cellulose biosynthesis protein BcsQ
MDEEPGKVGKVVTFYSYKGGTGRSMALANVACLLAPLARRGVLMIDWDLEAPGLHRYFHGRFQRRFPGSNEAALVLHPGLVDLFTELLAIVTADDADSAPDETRADRHIAKLRTKAGANRLKLDDYVIPTDVPSLSLLKAGRFDDGYGDLVNTFDWERLFHASPALIRRLGQHWASRYDYVLIDSRTGLTDTSGICTALLPEKLITVFTPNRQSVSGVLDMTDRAARYRQQSDDLRPLLVIPLASRIEASEPKLKALWRYGTNDIAGYQPQFEDLFRKLYGLDACDLTSYFHEVQIQHVPRYGYGEEIAVLEEQGEDRLSLTASYRALVGWLTGDRLPWVVPKVAGGAPSEQAAVDPMQVLERVYASLAAPDQATLLSLLTRLVRLPAPGEATPTRATLDIADLNPGDQELARRLLSQRVLAFEGEPTSNRVRFVHDGLLGWERLRAKVDQEKDVLRRREQLRTKMLEWHDGGRASSRLLSRVDYRVLSAVMTTPALVSPGEREYLSRSARRNQRTLLWAAMVLVALVVVGLSAYVRARERARVQKVEELTRAATTAVIPKDVERAVSELQMIARPGDSRAVADAYARLAAAYGTTDTASAVEAQRKALDLVKADGASDQRLLFATGLVAKLTGPENSEAVQVSKETIALIEQGGKTQSPYYLLALQQLLEILLHSPNIPSPFAPNDALTPFFDKWADAWERSTSEPQRAERAKDYASEGRKVASLASLRYAQSDRARNARSLAIIVILTRQYAVSSEDPRQLVGQLIDLSEARIAAGQHAAAVNAADDAVATARALRMSHEVEGLSALMASGAARAAARNFDGAVAAYMQAIDALIKNVKKKGKKSVGNDESGPRLASALAELGDVYRLFDHAQSADNTYYRAWELLLNSRETKSSDLAAVHSKYSAFLVANKRQAEAQYLDRQAKDWLTRRRGKNPGEKL